MALENASVPLSPSAVHRELVAKGKRVGVASVYRTLDLLVELELAKVVLQSDGTTGYVASKAGHNHTIVCQSCHKTYEFGSCADLSPMIEQVESETHFLVLDHLLQLYGLCPECQSANE